MPRSPSNSTYLTQGGPSAATTSWLRSAPHGRGRPASVAASCFASATSASAMSSRAMDIPVVGGKTCAMLYQRLAEAQLPNQSRNRTRTRHADRSERCAMVKKRLAWPTRFPAKPLQ